MDKNLFKSLKYLLLGTAMAAIMGVSCNKTKEDQVVSNEITAPEVLPNSIIEAEQLHGNLTQEKKPVVIEVSKLEVYQQSHIPGALHCWRTDFTSIDYPYGGMRMTPAQIEDLLARLGVNTGDSIVVYDKKGNADALRLWWLINLYGYSKVAVLNGGQPAWEQAGYPTSVESDIPSPGNFQFPSDTIYKRLLANMKDIEAVLEDSSVVLLDTRSVEEFSGEKQKSGALHPGHIPRSINLDWAYAIRYGEDFRFKSKKELTEMYEGLGLRKDKKIIVYCHSGVRSAHTAFVLREILGYPDVTNYDGSWTEWSHLAPKDLIITNLIN